MRSEINTRVWLSIELLYFSVLALCAIAFKLQVSVAILAVVGSSILLAKCINNPFPVILFLLIIRPVLSPLDEYCRIGVMGSQALSTIVVLCGTLIFIYSQGKIHHLIKDALTVIFSMYIVCNVISFYFNNKLDVNASFSIIFRLATYCSLYIAGKLMSYDKEKINFIFICVVLSLILPNCLGLYQFFTKTGIESRGVIAGYATFSHPNMYANFLAITSSVVIYCIIVNLYRATTLCLLLINVFLCIVCYGRAALVALILPFIIFGIVRIRLFLFVTIVASLSIPAVSIAIFFPEIYDGLYYRFLISATSQGDYLSSRTVLWSYVLDIFYTHKMLGVGPGLLWPYYSSYSAHNEFLRNLVEIGIVGTFFFTLLWIIMLYKILMITINNFSTLNITTFIILVQIVWLSLTSNLITSAEVLWPFWFIFGALTSYNKSAMDENG